MQQIGCSPADLVPLQSFAGKMRASRQLIRQLYD
jgi:hypothetical protein